LPTNVSYEFYNPVPILQPANFETDTYKNLTNKVYRAFQAIYSKYNDYDWYLKADDDTFVFVDNLKLFLKTKNASKPVTFGFDFKVIVNRGYHSGGGGYVLSNEALNRLQSKLFENYSYCPNTGVEDVDVAKCLRNLGVYPDKSIDEEGRERFHSLSIETHIKGNYPGWLYEYASNPLKSVIY
jgi:glycoprotein-N-acetylgalactosamine 3-beta-galactosyltransferase